MSNQSTVEYYRLVDEGVNEARGGHAAADLLIRSVDFADVERFIQSERWGRAGEYLAKAAMDLEAGGAEAVFMATNTMHKVAPDIEAVLSVPFVHIVDPTAEAVVDAGLDTVGVLGTETVMTASFYRDRFADHGIEMVVPEATDRETVDRIIFEELTHGEVTDESRAAYLDIVDDLTDDGAEGIVLGCTEIELLIDGTDRPDLTMFDTTTLHTDRAVEYALGEVED
jgi:aspartate racemase